MLRVQSFSEVGGHQVNEDAFRIETHPLDPDCVVCFLADGQGGQPGGGPAALLACQSALAAALTVLPKRLANPASWLEILRKADAAVAADAVAGFTTLVGLVIVRGKVVGASSGDSAALLISGGKPVELTAAQLKNPPVGCGMALPIPFAADLSEPWRILVMSDGVWKYVGWDRVVEVATQAADASVIDRLQQHARLPGSGRFPDDFTVVLLESLGSA
jgi:serine/threonine protein phosphatase PrpC